MSPLEILKTHEDENEILEKSIRELYDGQDRLLILEAGCGREWPLDLKDIQYRLIGVDLDEAALNSRINEQKDLDEVIVANLQDFDIGDRQTDVIYNSFVIEHLENPERMLDNFCRMSRPGGLIIIRLPDPHTVYGLFTRITPHWFHVFYKKYIHGFKEAGQPGYGPYPTHSNPLVSRSGIRQYCREKNLKIIQEYGFCEYLYYKRFRTRLLKVFAVCFSLLSFGRLPWQHDNLTYILKKEESPQTSDSPAR